MKLNCIAMSLLSVCVLSSGTALAEEISVNSPDIKEVKAGTCLLTGRVTDAETGEGIPMATITVQGTAIGTACDADGFFQMELIEGKSYNLLIRSTGYMEQRIKIDANGPKKELNITMNAGIFNLNEVVVTGTRTEKTILNTPVLTRLIPAAQLQRNDFENIMDALEFTIPGLQFNSDPRGDNIQIQGLENKYVLILIDGERLSNTPGGPIDFERLSTSNIKQIEVIKGAASALYGSSAIGMIVNIITKTPERPAEGWAKVRYSKYNEFLVDGSFGTTYKDFTSQTLFNRNSTDGYDLTPESPEAFTKQPSANMTFEEKLGWTHKQTKITGSGTFYLNDVKNPPLSTKSTHYKSLNKTLRATLEQQIGKYNQLKLVYYGDFYTRKTVYEKLDSTAKNASSNVQTLRLTDIYTPVDNLQMVFGGEFNWNKDYNDMQYGTEIKTRKVHDINGFVQADWQILPLLDIIGGFRYTHHSAFGNAYTPKVSLMFNPGDWIFRGGYSKGFKAPDATELYSDFMMGSVSHNIGNPNLKAEKSNYFSLSAEYLHRNFNISAEVYQNSIKNKIQSSYVNVTDINGITTTELRYSNVDDVRIRGAEISVDYYPIRQIYLHGSYAFTDALDKNTKLQLKGNIRHAISCNASYRFNVFKKEASVSVAGHWSSKKTNIKEEVTIDKTTGNMVQKMTTESQSAYSLWKLTLQYTPWKYRHMALTATAGVQNIFNYTDPVHYTTYDPGARAFGSILFKF